MIPDGYYAVPDPDDPGTMTYWRQRTDTHGPALTSWPPRARYGPLVYRRDVPKDPDERRAFAERYHARLAAWMDRVRDALTDDIDGARARFAVFQVRCCVCGRALRDAKSKTLGMGPECRKDEDEAVLAAVLTPAVAKAHAEYLNGGGGS